VNRKLARSLVHEVDSDPNAQRDFAGELTEALVYALDLLDLCEREAQEAVALSFEADRGASVRSKLHGLLANLTSPEDE
jgi:hypothetical protein